MREKRLWRWKVLYAIFRTFLLHLFHLDAEQCRVKGPCLIISNHVTNWDPLLLAMSFPDKPIRYVASEHIFRHGLVSKLLELLVAPIPRRKAAAGADTVMTVIRSLKAGESVCIFAEGDACWDGLTHPVFPATGKLARMSGATLITYRLEGGYLTRPRWAARPRIGKMHGAVVGIYSPDELKGMTGPEISALIDRDIFEDAWARQRVEHVRFRGKDRAEGIERGFFICPQCAKYGNIHGEGNRVRCSCGLDLYYTEEGLFEPSEPVATLADWELFQQQMMRDMIAGSHGELFSDEGMSLHLIEGAHGQTLIGKGRLSMTHDALICAEQSFALSEIDSMAMVKAHILLFSAGEKYYEIRAGRPCCMRKYLMSWQNAAGK